MSVQPEKIDPLQYLNKEFLTTRIEQHRARHAQLLQKAVQIKASAAKAERELLDDANATYGAIQQLEELLGMLAEEVGKILAGKPEAPPDKGPPADKPVKENQISRQRRRAAARKGAKLDGKVTLPGGGPVLNTSNAKPPHPDSTAIDTAAAARAAGPSTY